MSTVITLEKLGDLLSGMRKPEVRSTLLEMTTKSCVGISMTESILAAIRLQTRRERLKETEPAEETIMLILNAQDALLLILRMLMLPLAAMMAQF